ncbi:MAG: hypothetical protein KBH41_19870 [Azonexus sp.]|nr:hypothetical protein [Azonexus sp.]
MDFDELVIKATAPFRNGCSWRLMLTGPHATTTPQRIEYGCYSGPFAMANEAGDLLMALKAMDDWDGNGCTVKLKPETVSAAMKRECKSCHAPIFTTINQSATHKNSLLEVME